ncbi:MAG TPA: BrnT family toxin [Pyrinomonadaceae bacterium]|nr:BrnT family toxin [Pyrinomonadaceae bacterium]
MRFEWDEAKRLANLRQHGFDFVDGEKIFAGETASFLDDRFDYDETRFLTIGVLDGRVVAIIHTETDEVTRIISMRKALKNEEETYFNEIRN